MFVKKKIIMSIFIMLIGKCFSQVPTDVSFCIADVKFDGDNLKILEFGDCAESMFTGYNTLYGKGAVWAEFWRYLKKFGVPIWYVGRQNNSLGLETLKKIGGTSLSNTSELRAKIMERMRLQKMSFEKSAGIVFLKKPSNRVSTKPLTNKFSSLIFVNQIVRYYVINKYRTNLLFKNDNTVLKFRPQCQVCKKKYTPQLAQSIIESLKAPIYVIKPTNASCGRGVVFVERDELDVMLHTLLKDRTTLRRLAKRNYHTFGFWLSTKDQHFLVEEYVPSKPVTIAGKHYDATMRLVFAMNLTDGKIGIDVLGAYWKLPARALNEAGSLNEKHRSDVHSSAPVNSMKVSSDDLAKASSLLTFAMERIYVRMLRRYHRSNESVMRLLSS